LKKEAVDRTMWRARFGRGFGPVVRQTSKSMNESVIDYQSNSYYIVQYPCSWCKRVGFTICVCNSIFTYEGRL